MQVPFPTSSTVSGEANDSSNDVGDNYNACNNRSHNACRAT